MLQIKAVEIIQFTIDWGHPKVRSTFSTTDFYFLVIFSLQQHELKLHITSESDGFTEQTPPIKKKLHSIN